MKTLILLLLIAPTTAFCADSDARTVASDSYAKTQNSSTTDSSTATEKSAPTHRNLQCLKDAMAGNHNRLSR